MKEMDGGPIRVLLIEDSPADALLIREMLAMVKGAAGRSGRTFAVECADCLSAGLERLTAGDIDVMLLDLSLPDSWGFDTFVKARARAPDTPIVVLSGLGDEALALKAVREGAQDYLFKGLVSGDLLARAIRYAIERQRAEEALRQRNRELALLNRVGHAFSSTLDLDQVLATVLDEVRRLLDVVACSIWLTEPETGEVVCRQAIGPKSEIVRGWRLALGEGLAGLAARSGDSLIVSDAWADERYFEGVDRQTGLPLRSILTVPLWVKQRVIGVLQVVDTEVNRFSTANLALLEPLAASAAAAIENARLAGEASEIEILQELSRLRSELIANVSHELRTPLGLIKVFCTTLLREDVDFDRETQREFLHDIDEETDRLEKIVDNLLDLSRLESERLRLDKQSTDVGQLAREVMEAMRVDVEPAQYHLVHDFSSASLVAAVDPKRIEQVLRNLLSNAIKYSPDGGTIAVGGRGDDRQLLVWVRDQGMGVPVEHLERVFERFYRVENEVTQRVRGAGLGLAVCRGIVEAHGGRIWVESAFGVGSTFYFSLPVGDSKAWED